MLESFRSENENKDEFELVCLVLIHMGSCPGRVTEVGNWLSAAGHGWQRNFEEKLSQEPDFQRSVFYFQHIKNHQDVFFVECVIRNHHYCGHKTNYFFHENN